MFPRIPNPNIQLFIDNMVYEIGRTAELEAEMKIEEAKIKRQDAMFAVIIKAIVGR